MKQAVDIYYDEVGDYLEMSVGDITNCYFKNIADGTFEIVDKETNKTKGIAIFSFTKRTKNLKTLTVPFDFSSIVG